MEHAREGQEHWRSVSAPYDSLMLCSIVRPVASPLLSPMASFCATVMASYCMVQEKEPPVPMGRCHGRRPRGTDDECSAKQCDVGEDLAESVPKTRFIIIKEIQKRRKYSPGRECPKDQEVKIKGITLSQAPSIYTTENRQPALNVSCEEA